jgi:hypothetical protein
MTPQRMRIGSRRNRRFDRLPHPARMLITSTGSLPLRALGIIPEVTHDRWTFHLIPRPHIRRSDHYVLLSRVRAEGVAGTPSRETTVAIQDALRTRFTEKRCRFLTTAEQAKPVL